MPAFQLYADDFLSGTADMTPDEVGAYIRLLCHQWAKGGLPNDMQRLCRMSGMAEPSLSYVLSKFVVCADGQLRNERLERTREAAEQFRAERKASGKSGAEKRWKSAKPDSSAMPEPQAEPVAEPMANTIANDGSPSPSPDNNPLTPKGESVPDGFEEFWSIYPKKVSKPQGLRAYRALKANVETRERILADLRKRLTSHDWVKDGGRYIPNPATYLNGRRWEDQTPGQATVPAVTPQTRQSLEQQISALTWDIERHPADYSQKLYCPNPTPEQLEQYSDMVSRRKALREALANAGGAR